MSKHRAAWVRWVVACMLALGANWAHADDFDNLRQRWMNRITSGPVSSRASSGAQPATEERDWRAMDRSANRKLLWPDLPLVASSRITDNYLRLRSLALAYDTPGSPLYHNPDLLKDILDGVDWMHGHHYNTSTQWYGNWWDWQIGTPLAMVDICTLLYDELGAARLQRNLAAIDYFVPDPRTKRYPDGHLENEVGANLLDKSFVVIMRGVLGKQAERIATGRDAIGPALRYVDHGDGFYRDGSFIQHRHHAYAGGYGGVALNDVAQLLYLLKNSSWSVQDPNAANVYDWAENSFRPFVFNGLQLDATAGRGITRAGADERARGRGLMGTLARLAEVAPPARAAAIRGWIKGWLQRDPGPGFGKGTGTLPPALEAIARDDNIRAVDEPRGARLFARQDRAQLRGPGFLWQLSMFSDRISALEAGNGENQHGWWIGMGMAQLYQGGPSPHADGYWATVDMKRLPGTTTDHSGQGSAKEWTMHPNTSTWVGGAVLGGEVAALGMEFSTAKVTGSRLQARKSWFLFGDKILALGADITTPEQVGVETIVDNRMLEPGHPRSLQVDGQRLPGTPGWTRQLDAAGWVHLGGGGYDAGAGYVFPGKARLTAWREQRQGSWNDVGPGLVRDPAKDAPITRDFTGLAMDHGQAPQGANYAYVILPGRTAEQTAAFAAKPTVAVLLNTAEAAVACDAQTGAIGANVWTATKAPLRIAGRDWLRADSALALVVRRQGNVLELALADPSQRMTQPVHVELDEAGLELLAADSRITVEQTTPTLRLAVRFEGMAGGSLVVRFKQDVSRRTTLVGCG